MASSQVEITSSSPFGCVLKDSNKRSTRENSNARAAAFQKNLKELVRDHFHNCISISADENENENQSSKNQRDKKIDSRVAKQQGQKKQQQHHPQHNRNLRFLSNQHDRKNENKRNLDDSDVTTSFKQSRMLDRWAARQAREMVSSIDKESREAEQLASSSSTSSGNKNNLHCSPNVGNLGASSLFKIWEARLNQSKSMNMSLYSNSELRSSWTSSPGTEDPSRDSEMEDSPNSMNHSNHEESCTEWDSQSDRNAQSELSQGRNLDAGEKEKVRVADIIKKLTSANDENEMVSNISESPSRECRNSPVTCWPEQQRGLPLVINSTKIRGRQAFADLLMQLERDRHRELDSLLERQAVSRFTHRGRIQAMLRIRFLQRGLLIQDQQRPQSRGSLAKLLPQGSTTITHLREKFSTGVEGGAVHSDATATRSSHTEIVNNRVNMESSSTTNRQRSEDISHQQNQEAHNVGKQSRATIEHPVPQTSKDSNNRESSSRSNVETAHVVTAEATKLLKSGDRSVIADDREQQHTNLNSPNNSNSERVTSLEVRNENMMAAQQEQEANEHPHLADSQETADTTGSLNDMDEIEVEDYEQRRFVENNYDWISEISRPRSYWEDRRQAWYQEMLNNRSENEEIRRILERRGVSSILASDFRETMEQLMTSRIERQVDLEDHEDEEEDAISRERIVQLLLSHLQRHVQPAASQEEEQAGEEEEEEEDGNYTEEGEQIPTSHDQHHETSDYPDQSSSSMQMPSPTTMQSWGCGHHEVGDVHSDLVGSAPSPHQDSRMSTSCTNRLSIEMELICDLRGQMAQLHREMTELRKSIQSCCSCMDMQVTLQLPHPHPQEVHSVRETENNSLDVATKKRKCCICYEMNVDSLLYRCGHMCTCLKCAHELQWSSGKCPICRAPIADVVKAYMDS